MDNITHSLLGALVGETAHRFTPTGEGGLHADQRRVLGIGLMVAGNNLPDVDFLYSAFSGSNLDYVLQHRGYSHTIVGALGIAALMLFALRAWLGRRQLTCSRSDWRYLGALALLAPLIHIGLDFTNSYGVHPFWPVDDHWVYGDAVFIVEPLLWACAAPLLFTLRSRLARALVALPLAAALVLAPASQRVPWSLEWLLAAYLAAMLLVGRWLRPRAALLGGVAAWMGVTLLFFIGSRIADARIAAVAQQSFPAAVTLDRVLTPLPVNPLCHDVLLLQTEKEQYVVRKAVQSLAPGWLPASDCAPRGAGAADSPAGDTAMQPVAAPSSPALQWIGEYVMPRTRLAELSARHCSVRALLKFARAPWSAAGDPDVTVGDLRFAAQAGRDFAAVRPAVDDARCPRWLPGWIPPRQDLL